MDNCLHNIYITEVLKNLKYKGELQLKSTIHQNISIGSIQITRMSNAGVLRIGATRSVKRKPKIQDEPTLPFSLFTGVSGPHVPLRGIPH